MESIKPFFDSNLSRKIEGSKIEGSKIDQNLRSKPKLKASLNSIGLDFVLRKSFETDFFQAA